jgi:hypothetical protein
MESQIKERPKLIEVGGGRIGGRREPDWVVTFEELGVEQWRLVCSRLGGGGPCERCLAVSVWLHG